MDMANFQSDLEPTAATRIGRVSMARRCHHRSDVNAVRRRSDQRQQWVEDFGGHAILLTRY